MSAFPLNNTGTNTNHKLVLPFYAFAALAFLVSSVLLVLSAPDFLGHYFHPHILAITHTMAIGWGTMIIIGAGHQLLPVLIESRLYSSKLAYASFLLTAIGIPMLIYGFYIFDMGPISKWGGRFVLLGLLCFVVNTGVSVSKAKNENVHAVFFFTATIWLFITALMGLAQVYNFTTWLLPEGSLHYLSLHVHTGAIGWFLLLIIGVGSRLIPMFLISKYENPKLLWWIYGLIHAGLFGFIFIFFFSAYGSFLFIPISFIAIAFFLFLHFCNQAYTHRLRKQVDEPVKLSLLSIGLMVLPLLLLMVVILVLASGGQEPMEYSMAYGFMIFFGWITALILGMTFKTLPFIVWNKVYHSLAGKMKTPNPKDLFHAAIFNWMSLFYLAGLFIFAGGIIFRSMIILQTGSILLFITALLYTWNVMRVLFHKPVIV